MRVWICRAMMLVVATTAVAAYEQRPLPNFNVTSAAGAPHASAALSAQPRWVIIYVTPGCRSCDRLLQALKDWQSPQLTTRAVVIVRGPSAGAAAYMAERMPSEASGIAWYADNNNEAWQALDLKGAPVLVGVEGGEIKWTISGVLNEPKSLESVVRTWVEY